MAGKVTTIQPLGNQATSRIDGNQIPQQLGSTIFGAGNFSQSGYGYNRTNYVASAPLTATTFPFSKNRVFLAVTANDSGNVGTMQPLANGAFDGQRKGQYIIAGSQKTLAGQPNTLMNTPSQKGGYPRGFGNQAKGDTQLNILSWDYVTGKPNYGPNRGNSFTYVAPLNSGAALAMEQFPNNLVSGSGAVPSHLVFMVTGTIPASSVYGPRHDV